MPKQKPKTKPLRSFIVQSMPITHQATYRLMQKRMIQGLVALRILDNVLPRYTDIKTSESLTCLARANLDEACDLLFERRERYKILMEKSGLNIEMLKSSLRAKVALAPATGSARSAITPAKASGWNNRFCGETVAACAYVVERVFHT